MNNAIPQSLAARYESIRSANREAMLANEIAVDPLPKPHENRWGISTVFRPRLGPQLWADLRSLQMATGANHAAYDSGSIHVTIRSNEGFRPSVSADDSDVSLYAEAMRVAVQGSGSLEVIFKGMIAARTGVILCGYPRFDLMALRQRYYQELEARKAIRPGPEAAWAMMRNTCHASLLMFSDIIAKPVQAVAMLDAFAHRDYGIVRIEAFDVVSYHRTLEQIRTTTLAKIPLPPE